MTGVQTCALPIFLRTLFLSLDPYMRGRISGVRGYAAGVVWLAACITGLEVALRMPSGAPS